MKYSQLTESELNYGSQNLESSLTDKPFVRCNGQIPFLDKTHKITVEGVKWELYSLMRFRTHYVVTCMECAGNSRQSLPYHTEGLQWDNRAVSNVVWGGVLLREMLHKIPSGTKEIVFTSMDNEFVRSLPLEVIYERPVMIAYLMNYRDISHEHGGPMRLVVPGWYGMASVKWLDKIYLSDKPFRGKYQTEKYNYIDEEGVMTPVTTVLPKSLITSVHFQNPVVICGKAWSGNKIEKVELKLDDVWMDTDIKKRNGDYGWVTWEKKLNLKGSHKISTRATDVSGFTQPDTSFWNFYGYGNNAIQTIGITV